ILERLNAAEGFERFLHTKYVGHKRFSLEGAESLIPMLDFLLEDASRSRVEHVVMGMAHRGRLNVLVNIVGKSYARVFREFEGDIDPETIQGSGDVKYHVGTIGKFTGRDGTTITIELASNPSHLEAVDPVVEGMARAWQDSAYEQDRSKVLPLLLHGDAAFAGHGLPPAVPKGRGDRPRLLPALRPQRGGRPELHPAAHVPADRATPLGAEAVHGVAGEPGRHHGGRGRCRPGGLSQAARRSLR